MKRNFLRVTLCVLFAALLASPALGEEKAEDAKNQTAKNGDTVSVEYTVTVEGEVVDSSKERGPLTFSLGNNEMLPGFEEAVLGMKVGEEKTFTLAPEDAYGPVNPEARVEVPRENLGDLEPEVGMRLMVHTKTGETRPVTVAEVGENTVTLDLNHPLAGKSVTFTVKLVSIK
ncbi:MAG: peptidylprolyl isomerase [Nitrospirota bacterium]|jgi:FKBP-type peptidyl-prolyl cis-trans isomerase 2